MFYINRYFNCRSTNTAKLKFAQYFIEACALNPDSTAILTGTHRYSYRQLQKAALHVQSILKDVGVRQSQLVAICIPRSAALVAAMLGCVLHGTAFQLIDTSLPALRVKLLLEITRPCILLYASQYHSNIELALSACASILPLSVSIEHDQRGICINHRQQEGEIESSKLKVMENFECGDDVLYVIFTSGSTGAPKAVCVSVSGTLNRFEWMWKEYPFTSSDVTCFKTSVNFVDYIWEVFGALLKGSPLAVPLEEETKDPRLLADVIQRLNVTRLTLVPSYIRYLLEYTTSSDSLKSLTHCISSGEPLSLSLAKKFLRALPSCKLLNLYGTSEISADITYFEVTSEYVEKTGNSFVPIGKPIANVMIDVIDPNTGDVISKDSSIPGELVTYGVCVANSYLNSNDKSLVTSGLKSFNTHDLVHYNSSGDFMYIGRRDHQIKVRGVRINPSEIEAMLEKNSSIERAVVAADESHMNLISFIQINESHCTSKESSAVIEYGGASFFTNTSLSEATATELLDLLPQYLVPSLYVFTHRLPTLPSGKVSRKELPPLPEIRKLLSESVSEIKQLSKTEEQLCCIIKNLLQLSSVSLAGNFFALGGNSLSAIELASNIEESFHCKLSVSTIIVSPTMRSLATAIDNEIAKNATVSVCSDDDFDVNTSNSTGTLTFGQESVFVSERIADCDVYEIGVAAKCLQKIHVEYFWKSVHDLTMSHESLRTLFPCTLYGEPFQKVLIPDSPECLAVIASACSVVDCAKEHPLRFIDGQVSLPNLHANLSEGPLWKFTLFTNVLIPGEVGLCSVIAFQAHHIMTDGWSMQQLLTDLEDTYLKYVKETKDGIKHHNNSKPRYAIQQAMQQRSIVYDKQLRFWEARLRDAALPFFLHPKCIPSYTNNHESFSIHKIFNTPLSEITSFCQANSITEFTFALTGLLVAIYALNGLQDIVAIIPNASRNHENIKVSGLFDNCLPLRTMFNSTTNLHFLLKSVKDGVLNMIENQMPFLVLERELYKREFIIPNHPFFSGLLDQLLFVCDYKYSAAFSNSVLFQSIPILHSTTDFVMEFYVTVSMDSFDVQVVYSDQLYDASTIQVLLNTWESVMETMVKHVYLYVPLKLLCQDLYIPSSTSVHDEQQLRIEDFLLSPMRPLDSNEDITAVSLNCNEQITQQQISSIQQSLHTIISDLVSGGHATVITNLSLSAFVIALIAVATKMNCAFSFFSSLTRMVENLKEIANDTSFCIVVTNIEDHEYILKNVPSENLPSVSVVTIHSLLNLNPTDITPFYANSLVCSDMIIMSSKWQSDVKICSHLTNKYFGEVHCAAVLMPPALSTLPIATSLLIHGIPVQVFTYQCFDSFVQFVSKTGAEILVIPEITVPSILPKIVGCKGIKYLWIHGLPLGLAYISKWITASQHVQVIVTHSLVPEQHLITHHFNLKDIPSIEDGSIPCIPIGSMCKGLNGKVLHRDGRDVCRGFVGSFATMVDDQVHRSTSLVRQLLKDGSFELVSVNAEAYYKGIDVTPALFVLSTIPEVSWCGVSTGIGKDSIAVLYSSDVEGSRNEIRGKLLAYLSLSYLGIIYPLGVSPPITPDFTLDLNSLCFADSLLGPSMFSVDKDDDEVVDKIVRFVSKAFGIDSETVRQTSDLLAVGGMSTANILTLTVDLNTEFKGGYHISEVYQALRDGHLVELCRGRRQE